MHQARARFPFLLLALALLALLARQQMGAAPGQYAQTGGNSSGSSEGGSSGGSNNADGTSGTSGDGSSGTSDEGTSGSGTTGGGGTGGTGGTGGGTQAPDDGTLGSSSVGSEGDGTSGSPTSDDEGDDGGDTGTTPGSTPAIPQPSTPSSVPAERVSEGRRRRTCGADLGPSIVCFDVDDADGVEAVRIPNGVGGFILVPIVPVPVVNVDSGTSTSAASNVDLRIGVNVQTGDVVRVERRVDTRRQRGFATLAVLLLTVTAVASVATYLRVRRMGR